MQKRNKDAVLVVYLRQGPFSSEMIADVPVIEGGEPHKVAVPRRYCRRLDGTPFGDGEPGKKTVRGLLAASVVKCGRAGLVVVNVPDGSVIHVANVIVQEYPSNWDPKEDLNAEEEGNG